MEDSTNLKLVKNFCLYSRLQKDFFLFLIMLRTFAAKVCQNKLWTELQTDMPPRQLQGWQMCQMKDNLSIYNFVKRFKCEFSCILGGIVAQSKGKKTEV